MALANFLPQIASQIDVNLTGSSASAIGQTLANVLPAGPKHAEAYEFGYKVLPVIEAGFAAGQVPVETIFIRFEYYGGGPTSIEFSDLASFKSWIANPTNLGNAYPALSID